MLDLLYYPLHNQATVTWVDGSWADVTCLADLKDIKIPAVVSLTDLGDLTDRNHLLSAGEVADFMPFIHFIIATSEWWCPPEERQKGDTSRLRHIARRPNISLGLVCDNVTGVACVRGAGICWNYKYGTPATPPSTIVHWRRKSHKKTQRVVLDNHPIIGVSDWVERAKISSNVHPNAKWYTFSNE